LLEDFQDAGDGAPYGRGGGGWRDLQVRRHTKELRPFLSNSQVTTTRPPWPTTPASHHDWPPPQAALVATLSGSKEERNRLGLHV
jgi:hypothetical protein